MAEKSRDSYGVLFQSLKERGLTTPKLVISDAYAGLVAAIRESFPGASWHIDLAGSGKITQHDRSVSIKVIRSFVSRF